MTAPIANAQVYGNFAGLESLKRAARSDNPAAIREVARQFESLFAHMLIKSMRDAIGPDPIFGSDQEQTYQGMYDDQLSLELTRGHGLGLADMLVRQLQHKGLIGGGRGSTGAAQSPDTAPAGRSLPSMGSTPSATGSRAAARAPAVSRADQRSFIRDLWPQARRAAQQLGVAPESLVAQAALETDWGRSVPQDAAGRSSNNLFGIKADGGWEGPSVSAVTREFAGGGARATTAPFRAYGSPTQSFQDYVALLQSDPRYVAALHTGSNVEAFASALQRGGYATDPQYASKVSAVAGDVASALAEPATVAQQSGAASNSADSLKLASAGPITAGADSIL